MRETEPVIQLFSIAPNFIYGALDWRDEQVALSKVIDTELEHDHVEVVKVISSNLELSNPLPSKIHAQTEEFGLRIDEIHNYFNLMTEPTSEIGFNTVQVRLKNFSVIKNQIVIRKGSNLYALYEMNRPNERYLFPAEYFANIDWSDSKSTPELVNSYLSVSAGSPNWGHFLIDELPRICMFIDGLNATEPVNIYFTDYSQQFERFNQNREDTVTSLFPGRSIDFHFLSENQVNHFESATYISPATFHPFFKNKRFLEYPRLLNNLRISDSANAPKDKVFCIRTSGARSLSESAIMQLRSLFEPLGYFFYSPEKYSVEDQFKVFSEAKLIIGLMGAGMCNSMFSPPGTKLYYIAPNGWEETFFWNLANQLGHEYHVYYSNTHSRNSNPEENDFNLDVEEFLDFYLDSLG